MNPATTAAVDAVRGTAAASVPRPEVLVAAIEELFAEVERGEPDGAGSLDVRLWPLVADLRRGVYAYKNKAGLLPVPIFGSRERGLRAGYFASRLRDGSWGFYQRRADDCLRAALATLLRVPMPKVPDAHRAKQLAEGLSEAEVNAYTRELLEDWLDERGWRLAFNKWPPSSGRWIAVKDGDHCLLMEGSECVFDPARFLPPARGERLAADMTIDYAITAGRTCDDGAGVEG